MPASRIELLWGFLTRQAIEQRGTEQGASYITQAHGRYEELINSGQVYYASLQAATATSLLVAAQTGIILYNPPGSKNNFYVLDIPVALASAPAGISTLVGALGAPNAALPTGPTPINVRSALTHGIPTDLNVGQAYSALTLPAAPVVSRPLGGGPVATGSVTAPFLRDETAGIVCVPPGATFSICSLTTVISIVGGIYWRVRPIIN
jgi:hypothetical protein